MLMTPFRMVLVRVYACTLGRVPGVARLVRWMMLNVRIRRRWSRFDPSSRFFTPDELEK